MVAVSAAAAILLLVPFRLQLPALPRAIKNLSRELLAVLKVISQK